MCIAALSLITNHLNRKMFIKLTKSTVYLRYLYDKILYYSHTVSNVHVIAIFAFADNSLEII